MEPPPLVQQVLDRGKKGAADYLKNCRSPELLYEVLDRILSHEIFINDEESIDWIKWLMAGGKTPDEFAALVKKYNNATTCGLVWTANFIAYRCRTCGISPCMSLCADCFQRGHHDGHDFNMFRSQAGGACDCGDTSVMRSSGFCDKHGAADESESVMPPPDLMYIADIIAPRIFFRLILYLRNIGRELHSNSTDAHSAFDADNFLTMLSELSSMGSTMRRVLTNALTNSQVYKKLTQEWVRNDSKFAAYMAASQQLYEEALESLGNPDPPPQFRNCPGLQKELKHSTFLEELVFWTVKYEFPQKVVCFLLNMLPEIKYKEALTKTFVVHYSRIAMILEKTADPDTLSNRIVHVSVQLFSNEKLAVCMTEEFSLLEVMVVSLKNMMSKTLIARPINTRNPTLNARAPPLVVDCGLPVMKDHCYWPLVSDLNNVLSHRPVAVQFMNNDTLTNMWFSFLSYFQGMNVNQRELNQHIEFEPNTYYAAFSAELEASAYPMWALLTHLNSPTTIELTQKMRRNCLAVLEEWIEAVDMADSFDENQVSFHIPLHRYLATFICQAVNVQQVPLADVLPPDSLIAAIIRHPLRIQVAFYEIVNGLWVRNGLQIKGQAMTYIQCNFCSSMVDADLYLLQILATQLNPVDFMANVVDKFHIKDCLSFSNGVDRSNATNDNESDTPMLESFLQFIATLCSNRTNLGVSYYGTGPMYPVLTRLEMVTLLCVSDKPHSQLTELMPERCGTGQLRDFDAILAQVSEYRRPIHEVSGNMHQGLYIPKPCVWKELYDPIHVLLRAVQRKDFQNSMDRFTEFVRQNNLLPSGTAPWPPYRIPTECNAAYKDPRCILETRLFHAVIWIILYKAVYVRNISEHVMSLAMYLLEMALAKAHQDSAGFTQVCSQDTSNWVNVTNLELGSWFLSDWLSQNVRTTIRYIVLPPSEIQGFFENSSLYLKQYPPSLRSLLEVGERFGSNPPEMVQSGSSTSLVPTDSSELVVALPTPSHRYGMSSNLELTHSSVTPTYSLAHTREVEDSQPSSPSTSSNLSNELMPHYVQSFPTMLPVISRKPGNSNRKSSAVVVSGGSVSSMSDMKIIDANQSIISLLLKLHSHLSGYPDSFNPENANLQDLDNRIGDGPAFIGKVLTRIMMLDELCREEVLQCRQRLWPQKPYKADTEKKDLEGKKKSEQKRLVRERQQKLMESFANMRKEFIEKNLDVAGEDKMDWEGSDQPQQLTQKEYHCVICNQSSPSTQDQPMGLIVLVQATSVLGHKRKRAERPVLPVCDRDRNSAFLNDTLANDFEKKVEELSREFDKLSWWQSINLGWEGGIHVQTCGHHLHLECLTSYLQSLRNQQRVVVDRFELKKGEYLCPLCRQLANSVLPMPPDVGENAAVSSKSDHIPTIITDIGNLMIDIERDNVLLNLERPPDSSQSTPLMDAMKKSMGDMTECTYSKFLQRCDPTQVSTFFLFVTSIARTNLEIDIVQRGGSLLKPDDINSSPKDTLTASIPKRSCLMPLLHVLATHARMLAHPPVWETWQQLTGVVFKEHTSLTLNTDHKNVPLLLRDPAALLIQFVLLLPLNMDQMYFTGIVKLLYNLLYFQVMAQLSCHLKETERNYFRAAKLDMSAENLMKEFSLDHAMKLTIESMDRVQLYLEDGSSASFEEPARKTLELKIQELCLPFLRVASVLRHYMYNEPLPGVLVEADEFVRLVYYLELVSCGMDRSKFNSAVVFTWPNDKLNFIDFWFEQFSYYVSKNQIWARNFLSEFHISWKQPKLLELPRQYDVMFQYYHQKKCSHCQQVPQKGSICLVCGTLVCFKQTCCKRGKINEAIQHSIDCGAGTAMFLVITSSCVIVVRGKRACIWGSVYLDTFGEEDSELKRGKPLFLSEERYHLLEQQWLLHRFDHTSKKWIMHRDGL